MDLSRRRFLGTAVAGTAFVAGCTGDSPNDGERMATETPTDSPTDGSTDTPTGGGSTATVQVRSHPDLGDVLVDSEGMTLYMFDQDTQGEGASSCSGSCVDNWPPLTVDGEASAGSGVSAELSTFEREDGSTQVAADGWPLYYFTPDEEPGDAAGQGVNDVWWVLRPDGSVVRSSGDGTGTETEGRY
ncbi:hypothetical protein B4589_008045 [Halolamina sp. CBA1230]|uniref:COG4315 family predicted lipoprotein n=1 Tax=Halolamina sp. CBA1230 TaxID=1853690 RepID=UPI0009A1E12E|nr:hypothetical protein [Halolamina sp. CBA1230]QKY20331.1 hypothetical protein B4589_008045 [Halolamina sp. CBA1230]